MLDLILGIELRTAVELVSDTKYRTGEIGLGLLSIVRRICVVHLAVSPQLEVRKRRFRGGGGCRNRRRRRRRRAREQQLLHFLQQYLVLFGELLQLRLYGLQLLLQLIDLLL